MEKQMPNRIYFNSSISKFEKVQNTGFLLGRARIAYAGENRNGSYISRETFDSALGSLSLIPVVGNWMPEKNNFGGHDYAIEGEGNTLRIVEKTRPYGVVMENHNAEWVDVEDGEGNIKKYLECDVVLWEEKYQEPIKKVVDGGVNQSMEIVPTRASFNNNTGLYDVDSFYYSALCLLGRDEENSENNIEPCFEDSQIVAYQFNLNKEEFKFEFKLMMDELKSYFKGGESVEEKKFEEEEIVKTIDEAIEETTEEFVEETTEEVEETTIDTSEEAIEEVAEEEIIDEDFELKYNELLEKYNELEVNYKSLESEVIELKEFKATKEKEEFGVKQKEIRQEKINHINTEYESISDDIKELFISKVDEYDTTDDIDADICVYIVKNKVTFSKVKKESTTVKVSVEGTTQNPIASPYGDLF